MTDREFLLAKLAVGDIFHAEYPNGALCICSVRSSGQHYRAAHNQPGESEI
jgi:hypothetical protein